MEVPKTVSRDRIQQHADEEIADIPAPKVLQELVERRISERIVEQITDVLVSQMAERISVRSVEQNMNVPASSFDEVDCE